MRLGVEYKRVQFCPPSVYTIVEVKSGNGSSAGWGRLKSGIGWLSLDFVKRVLLNNESLLSLSVRIVNEVPHINRICYDITSKLPATVEWE